MLSLSQLKRPQPPAPEPEPELPKGWLRTESAATLLATPRRQKLLEHIWQRTSLSRQQFNTLYLAPLHRYAELVQQFPASESHHHAYPGGMLDHGLEIVAYALKLRQSHLLPTGLSTEDQAAQSEVWTAATAYAAQALGGDPARALAAPKSALQRKLLDGLRYLLKHELKLNQPQASDGWLTGDTLWLVSKTVSDKLRAHLLAQGIDGIPANNTAVFNVLQEHGMLQPTPEGKAIWKATMTSDTGWSHSFTLLCLAPALIWEASERPAPFAGTVVIEATADEADSASPEAPEFAPAPVAQPTAPESASSMPVATSAAGAMDELISLLEPSQALEPEPPAQPATLPASTNVQQPSPKSESAPTATQPDTHATPSAEHFMAWLKHALATRKLILNDAKALVHTVNDTVFLVTPGIFQRYAQEHPQTAAFANQEGQQDWQWLQKRFEKLGVQRRQPNGLNIWGCEVTGPRKSRKLHGYLLTSADMLFNDNPPNNPYLTLSQDE